MSCLALMFSFIGTTDIKATTYTSGVINWTNIGEEAYIEGLTNRNITYLEVPSEFVSGKKTYRVVSIKDEAFINCPYLTSVSLPRNVKIGKGVFKNCSKLKSIDFPENNPYLQDDCFYNCESLEEVTLHTGILYINKRAFYGCKSLTHIELPESLEIISENAFENCTRLKEVILPDNVEEVREKAFYNCNSISDFTIGKSLNKIGWDAIRFNRDLHCYAPEPPEASFYSLPLSGRYLYIPFNSYEKYIENSNWTRFENYFPVEGVKLEVDASSASFTEDGITYKLNTDGESWSVVSVDKDTTTAYVLKHIGEKPVKGIAPGAFEGCKGLKTVSLPPLMASVGEGAFEGCSSLTDIYFMTPLCPVIHNDIFKTDDMKIVLHVPVGTIERYEEVLPGNIISDIKETDFTSTVIDGVLYEADPSDESSPAYVSAGNSTVSKAIIHSNVNIFGVKYKIRGIRKAGFAGCGQLEEVDIEPGIEIPEDAFNDCPSIRTVRISVEDAQYFPIVFNSSFDIREMSLYDDGSKVFIPEGFLKDRKLIRSFKFPENTTYIYNEAFSGCESITELVIPETAIIKGIEAFRGCISLKNINITTATVEIPIGAFIGCTSLESIQLPDNMTSVGNACFKDCTSLKDIHLPDNLEYLGSNTFENCTSLERIVFPNNKVKFIDSEAFKGCTSLCEVSLPDTYGSSMFMGVIEKGLFEGCTSLKEIKLSHGIKRIYESAFKDCTSLEKIEFYTPIESAGDYAFQNTGFTRVIFSSLKSIGTGCFSDCQKLTAISLPVVEKLSNGAFDSCSLLEVVELSEKCKEIGKYAFFDCTSLPSFTLPSNECIINTGAFQNCSGLSEFIFPSDYNVSVLSEDAFYDCSSLKEIVFPESIRTIKINAFAGCSSLEKVYFNKDFYMLEYGAFSDCGKLREVYCPSPIPPLWKIYYAYWPTTFATFDTANLYVPEESIPLYRELKGNPKGESGWYQFKNILPIESASVGEIESDNFDEDIPVEIFSVNGTLLYKGLKSGCSLPKGIYIIRQGSLVKKVFSL